MIWLSRALFGTVLLACLPSLALAQSSRQDYAVKPGSFRLFPNTYKVIVHLSRPAPYRVCSDKSSQVAIVVYYNVDNRQPLLPGECLDFEASIIRLENDSEIDTTGNPEASKHIASGTFHSLQRHRSPAAAQ